MKKILYNVLDHCLACPHLEFVAEEDSEEEDAWYCELLNKKVINDADFDEWQGKFHPDCPLTNYVEN